MLSLIEKLQKEVRGDAQKNTVCDSVCVRGGDIRHLDYDLAGAACGRVWK